MFDWIMVVTYPEKESLDLFKSRIDHHLIAFEPGRKAILTDLGICRDIKFSKIRITFMEIITNDIIKQTMQKNK